MNESVSVNNGVHEKVLPTGTRKSLSDKESFTYISSIEGSSIKIKEKISKVQLHIIEKERNHRDLFATINDGKQEIRVPYKSIEACYFTDGTIWVPLDRIGCESILELLGEAKVTEFGEIPYQSALLISLQGKRLTPEVNSKLDVLEIGSLDVQIPVPINATPYPYQLEGFKWLSQLSFLGTGGLLGDEMGLGKTLQVIMLLRDEINKGNGTNLVVCPPSLLENWRRELLKFADIQAYVHHGDEKHIRISDIKSEEVVITTFDAVRRDELVLANVPWNVIAVDEAQYIKNANSQRHLSLRGLDKRIGIAVTGTPIENRLLDLWSLIDFVVPGILGDSEWFQNEFLNDEKSAENLREIVSPLILRRRVLDVAKDLPDVIRTDVAISMSKGLANEYEAIRKEAENSKNSAFATLTRLRVLSAHGVEENFLGVEGKIEYLQDTLSEIMESNQKAIIFTPFNNSLELIMDWFAQEFPGKFAEIINGKTEISERQRIVDLFTDSTLPGILVMNPKAGGVGLNITTANHVFHFAPDWNPAVMDQASARSYRRGQKLPVHIHNMFYAASVEEYMFERLAAKRRLSDAALHDQDNFPTIDEIMKALDISPLRNLDANL